MLELTHQFIIPGALSLLPSKMNSPEARALVLATGLQESRLIYRYQVRGPARGLWQNEENFILALRTHPRTKEHFKELLRKLLYNGTYENEEIINLVTHNDILAAGIARLGYWALPIALPKRGEYNLSWGQYLAAWNAGRPHREFWDANYKTAWDMVDNYADTRSDT